MIDSSTTTQEMSLEKPQVERIKDDLKKFQKMLNEIVNESSEYSKKIQLEQPSSKERYYHDGKADNALGVKIAFDALFFDELQA